jgi:hypothetical protein
VYSEKEFAKHFLRGENARITGLDAAVIKAAYNGRRVLRAAVPYDLGKLWRSVKIEIHTRPNLCALVVEAPHAAAMEFGTRPFTPPFKPLLAWAERKGPTFGVPPEEIKSFARAVWQTIRVQGLKARFYTRDSLPQLRKLLALALKKAVRKNDGNVTI